MTSWGVPGAASGSGAVTRQEVLDLDRGAVADLLVKLSRRDPGLAQLLRHLQPAPAPSKNAARAFAEPFMVGESPAMNAVFEAIRRFARTDAPVLIQGESGTGKELAAQAIHERSAFAAGPFVAINCGGLPSGLIASELFGHEKGAFTGAHQRKIGKLELANGGTLVLDEIGDMPLELQPHLLRFLQELTIERVGGSKPVPLNLRVVAATNRDLVEQVRRGAFREDLFHRLNCLTLSLPPLRERGEDLDLLSGFFVRRFSAEMGAGERRLGADALSALHRYDWPGNVRELISTVRRAVVMSDNPLLTAHDLGLEAGEPSTATTRCGRVAQFLSAPAIAEELPETATLESAKALVEERLVRDCLERHAQNVTSAARDLGVSRVTLYRLIEKYNLRDEKAPPPQRAGLVAQVKPLV